MDRNYFCFLVIFQIVIIAKSWPDGAPCLHAAFESMNPLEAVEHQGGLQLSDPPFFIEVDRQCYWRNQPISLTLKGNSTKDKFKGFVIQPIVWKGSKYGKRIGQFLRLDDNGSWQQQCFRRKDSVTHSHHVFKTQMMLWWKNDEDESQYVQFVATVVVNLKKFWVKSVFSVPVPPCRLERSVTSWTKPPITVPPPPNQFKMDTWRLFNHESSGTFPRSIDSFPEANRGFKTTPIPTTNNFFRPTRINRVSGDVPMTSTTTSRFPTTTQRPVVVFRPNTVPHPESQHRQKLTHIIPLPNMETNRRHKSSHSSTSSSSQPSTSSSSHPSTSSSSHPSTSSSSRPSTFRRPVLVTIPPLNTQRTAFQSQSTVSPTFTRLIQINNQIAARLQQQRQNQGIQHPQFNRNQCVDVDLPGRCFGWIIYCGQSSYMQAFCRRTCRFC